MYRSARIVLLKKTHLRPAHQASDKADAPNMTNWENPKPSPAALERRRASRVGCSSFSPYSSDTCRGPRGVVDTMFASHAGRIGQHV